MVLAGKPSPQNVLQGPIPFSFKKALLSLIFQFFTFILYFSSIFPSEQLLLHFHSEFLNFFFPRVIPSSTTEQHVSLLGGYVEICATDIISPARVYRILAKVDSGEPSLCRVATRCYLDRMKKGNWKDSSGTKGNFWLGLLLKARAQDDSAKKTFVKEESWLWDAVKKVWNRR